MRISDWSSDVCSSDLADPREAHGEARLVAFARMDGIERDFEDQRFLHFAHRSESLDSVVADEVIQPLQLLVGEAEIGLADGEQLTLLEIGRASCRERVCQYV